MHKVFDDDSTDDISSPKYLLDEIPCMPSAHVLPHLGIRYFAIIF